VVEEVVGSAVVVDEVVGAAVVVVQEVVGAAVVVVEEVVGSAVVVLEDFQFCLCPPCQLPVLPVFPSFHCSNFPPHVVDPAHN